MPFFSVIIPTYNRYQLLKRAIDSVLNQTLSDFELIVVDDGSSDDTSGVAIEYEGRITYIRQDNGGVSRARNRGIHLASSPYIAFLDSDDVWLPEKLKEQCNYINSNPDVLIHQTDELWIRNGKRINPMKKHMKKEGAIFLESLDRCMISPSSVVIKGELFERFGLFDEDLPVCEDYDLWLRIAAGERVGLIEKKLIAKYGGHRDQLSRRFWGMDRFRVYAIIKLLMSQSGEMKPEYIERARKTALIKSKILYEGAIKRKKFYFAETMRALMEGIIENSYSNIDFEILLRR
jgi:glycosyltransferase involved in cell wall biosynthesis